MAMSAAYAQEADTSSGEDEVTVIAKTVEEATVGGFKTDTPLVDVPQTVNIFSKEQIEDQSITSVGEIVDYTPGVNNSQGEGHRDAIVFRGQDRGTSNFFVDGVRDDVQYFRSLYNLDQVEVLLGPNALFFGRGSAGGVVNRVTKKAKIGEEFNEYLLSVDSFGATYGQFDYNTTINDKLGFRLNLFAETLENHRDFFDGERFGINPTLTYKFSDDTDITFSYEYNNHNRFIDRGIPSNPDGSPADQLSGTTFGDENLNFNDLESHTFNVSLNHQFSDNWKGRLTAFYGNYDKVYSNLFPSAFDGVDGVTIDGYIDSTERETFSFTGDVFGEFSTGSIEHKVVAGIEFSNTSSQQNRFNAVFTPDTNNDSDTEVFSASNFRIVNGGGINAAGTPVVANFSTDLNDDTDVSINAFSIYAQDEIALSRYVDVVLGARFDSFNIDVTDNEPGSNNGGENTDSQISPRLGIIVKPVEEVSLYASYSETFQPRSGDQFTDLNSSDGDNLDADEFSNLEAGVKWNITSDLLFTASAFQIEQTSLDEIGTTDIFEVLDTRTNGVEVSVKGQISDKWYISAGYSYLDGEIEGSGLTPREQPEHTVSVWSRYQINDKFGIGLGFLYQDESFADSDNEVTLPSYVRFDAAAYYNINDSYSLQLNIENLFDRDFFPSAHSNDNITVGAPINAKLTLKGRF